MSLAEKWKAGLQTALGVPEIKQKVLAATSNDQWGPTGTQMREIADATHHYADFGLIMETIWERLNDHGKYWRHVYKGLLLLDYLLKNGADGCVREARVKMVEIKTLTEFQHIDSKDKDVGLSVRERAKAIVELLHDERRLNEERTKARTNRGKFSESISSEGRAGGGSRAYRSTRPSGPASYTDEQDYPPPSRYGGSTGGGATRSPATTRKPNPAPEFSDDDDFSDEDVGSPSTYAPPSGARGATSPPVVQKAPAPVPLINLLDDIGTTPAPAPTPAFTPFPSSTPTTSFPGGPTPQFTFPGTSPAPAPSTTSQFTFPGSSPAPSTTSPYPSSAPTSGFTFPSGPSTVPPSSTGFPFPQTTPTTSTTFPPTSTTPSTPAFFQPVPSATDAEWSDFQGSAPKQAPPTKVLDADDPWARKDLFSFDSEKDKKTNSAPKAKTPMGVAAPVKPNTPSSAPMGTPMIPSGNPYGMGTPMMAPMGTMPGMMAPMGVPTMAPGMMMPPGASMVMTPNGPMMVAPGVQMGYPYGPR